MMLRNSLSLCSFPVMKVIGKDGEGAIRFLVVEILTDEFAGYSPSITCVSLIYAYISFNNQS